MLIASTTVLRSLRGASFKRPAIGGNVVLFRWLSGVVIRFEDFFNRTLEESGDLKG